MCFHYWKQRRENKNMYKELFYSKQQEHRSIRNHKAKQTHIKKKQKTTTRKANLHCLSRYSCINNESELTEITVCSFINVFTTFHIC